MEEGSRVGAIFLESSVVGAFRHVSCMCVCARAGTCASGSAGWGVQARVYGHECVCGMCAPVPLCLQGDKCSSRSCNQGKESVEISTS